MALISQTGIIDGQTLYAEHILRIINALSAISNNDILISGNLYNTGSFYQFGTSSFSGNSVLISSSLFILPANVSNNNSLTRLLVIDSTTGQISYKDSTSLTSSANFSGSFSGSFQGDGSQLTGIGGGSSKWTGSSDISRLGNVSITGSLRITSALTSSIISASSGLTGSLFGTSSWATNSSQSISSSIAISSSISQTSSFARSGNGIFSGSFSGSFQGDGSNLTGIVSSKWTGSTTLSRLGNVIICGSLATGENTTATGIFTHAEGYATTASNGYSHAEGSNTQAKGNASHAEGQNTIACGSFSHAEGVTTIALGVYSHAEGQGNIAIGEGAHVEGYSNSGSGDYSLVIGAFNRPNASPYAFIIGNGVNTGGGRSNLIFASASRFEISGSLFVTNSIVATQNISASIISGSFYGDGSNLTGITGGTGSSKWTGSSDISRLGNVSVTGSLNVSSSGAGFNTIGTSLFTGPITASIISGSAVTGSLLGTSSWAINSSQSISSSVAISASWAPSSGGSSKWTGSSDISRLGNVNVTGSFVVSGSNQVNLLGATQFTGPITASIISASSNITASGLYVTGTLEYNILGATQFTGPITASIISGSAVTGSLLGTASFAVTASYAFNTINPAVNTDQRVFETSDFTGVTFSDMGSGGSGGTIINSNQYGNQFNQNVIGVWKIVTLNSSSGSAHIYKGYNGSGEGGSYVFGRGFDMEAKWRIAISGAISASSDDLWTGSIGFMDTLIVSAQTQAAYFTFSPNINSGRWVCRLVRGTSSSSINTNITPNTSYSIYQINCNPSGTALTFSIDGNPVASSSTNIPTASNLVSDGMGWWVRVAKSSGSQDRGFAIDWYSLAYSRTSPR